MRALLLIAAVVVAAAGARADERGDWFKALRQPGTGLGCCDISDCAATDADWRDGAWWAVDPAGKWRKVPPAIVIGQPSIDGQAYLCAGAPTGNDLWRADPEGGPIYLYCFVPPTFGS